MDTVAESTRAVKSLQRRRPTTGQAVQPPDQLAVPWTTALRAAALVRATASRAAPCWRESTPLSGP
jgi:hypothetical protein